MDKRTKQLTLSKKRKAIKQALQYAKKDYKDIWYNKIWIDEMSILIREYTLTKIK